jgi:hypothetical protein
MEALVGANELGGCRLLLAAGCVMNTPVDAEGLDECVWLVVVGGRR